MKKSLPNNKVKGISLELTTFCNLKCKLCAHNYIEAKKLISKKNQPLNFWINKIQQYTNLNTIVIAGILSESTLYPDLIELIDYIKSRNIKIELYTNGNTHDEKWWRELSKHLNKKDMVVFTVCGSTQELHEYYRVGSNLQQILNHVNAFKTEKKNDWCQHILFEYNKDDMKNMDIIFKQFSNKICINSLPYQERFNVIANKNTNIKMINKLSLMYKFIMSNALKNQQLLRKTKTFNILCKNFLLDFIWLDSNGNPYPCFIYQLFCDEIFDNNDYSKILDYKYDFCFECEKHTHDLLTLYGIEEMG